MFIFRILAKYYDSSVLSTPQEQKKFEKNLFGKTHKANSEIIMFEGMTCLYKSNVDLFFYIIGSGIKPPPPVANFLCFKIKFLFVCSCTGFKVVG